MEWSTILWIALGLFFAFVMIRACGGMMGGGKGHGAGGCCGGGGGGSVSREADGSVASATPGAVTYTCPMHPEVVKSSPGKCPKCGMDLVRKE